MASAATVAFGRDLYRAGWALFATLASVAGLAIFAGAYVVGGLLLLVALGGLFSLPWLLALLGPRHEQRPASLAVGRAAALPPLAALTLLLLGVALYTPWEGAEPTRLGGGAEVPWQALIPPFELVALVVLTVVSGALVLVRRAAHREEAP